MLSGPGLMHVLQGFLVGSTLRQTASSYGIFRQTCDISGIDRTSLNDLVEKEDIHLHCDWLELNCTNDGCSHGFCARDTLEQQPHFRHFQTSVLASRYFVACFCCSTVSRQEFRYTVCYNGLDLGFLVPQPCLAVAARSLWWTLGQVHRKINCHRSRFSRSSYQSYGNCVSTHSCVTRKTHRVDKPFVERPMMRHDHYRGQRSHGSGRNAESFGRMQRVIANEANIRAEQCGRGATLSQTTWGMAIDNWKRPREKLLNKLNCMNQPRRAWQETVDPYAMVKNYCRAVELQQEPDLDITDWLRRTMQNSGVRTCETVQFFHHQARP